MIASTVLLDDGFQHADASGWTTTPAVGTASGWTLPSTGTLSIAGNLGAFTPSGNNLYYSDVALRAETCADQAMACYYDLIAGPIINDFTTPGIVLRWNTGGDYYYVQLNPFTWQLAVFYGVVGASTLTLIGSAVNLNGTFSGTNYYAMASSVQGTTLAAAAYNLGTSPTLQTAGIAYLASLTPIGTFSATDSHVAGTSGSKMGVNVSGNVTSPVVNFRRVIACNASGSPAAPTAGTASIAVLSGTDTISFASPTAGTNPIGGELLFVGSTPGGESGTPAASAVVTGSGSFTHATGSPNYYIVKTYDSAYPPNLSAASNEVADVAPAASYTLAGPASGGIGVPSSTYTITLDGPPAGTIAVTVTVAGAGLSTTVVRNFSGSTETATFTITPPQAGTVTLTPSNDGSLADPSALHYIASATVGSSVILDEGYQHANASGWPTTPAVGGVSGWTLDTTGTLSIAGNLGAFTPSGNQLYYSDVALRAETCADQVIIVYYGLLTNGRFDSVPGIILRVDGSGNYYYGQINPYTWQLAAFRGTLGAAPLTQLGATTNLSGAFGGGHYYTLGFSAIGPALTLLAWDLGTSPTAQTGGVAYLASLTPLATLAVTDANIPGSSSSRMGINVSGDTNLNAISHRRVIACNATVGLAVPTAGTASIAAAGGIDTISFTSPTAGTNPIGGELLFVGSTPGGESIVPSSSSAATGSGSFAHATGLPNCYTVRTYDTAYPANLSVASNEVLSPGPTTATLSGPSAGPVNAQSAAYSVTLNTPAQAGGVVVTPQSTIGGDTFQASPSSGNVATVTIPAGSTIGTFFQTPSLTPGARSISIATAPALTYANSPLTYTASSNTAASYSVSGPSGGVIDVTSTNFAVPLNGLPSGTQHVTVTPSGGGVSAPIVLTYSGSTTTQTFSILPTLPGTVTLTFSSSPQLGTDPSPLHYTVADVPTTWGYFSVVEGFAPGLPNVGYTVYAHDGTVYSNPRRITAAVNAIGVDYGALVQLTFSGGYKIEWDDGNGHTASDVLSPRIVTPSGFNEVQVQNLLLAAAANKVSGNLAGASNPVFVDTDGQTPRISGVCDQFGNRTSATLTPPT